MFGCRSPGKSSEGVTAAAELWFTERQHIYRHRGDDHLSGVRLGSCAGAVDRAGNDSSVQDTRPSGSVRRSRP